MEGLITRLTNARSGFLSRLFGYRGFRYSFDPEETEAVIRKIERRVYGAAGLDAYEKSGPSEWRRLAKRTLAQYLCQRALVENGFVRFTQWMIFWLSLGPVFLYLFFRFDFRRREPADTVVFENAPHLRKLVPQGTFWPYKSARLRFREIGFLLRVTLGYPRILLHPGLLFNLVRWLSYYAYVRHHFQPKTIVNFFEGSCSSSLITAYLREAGIRHVNVMHGEMFPFAGNAFAEFDEFRVWGEHFRELFETHRCPNLVVSSPEFHRRLFENVRPSNQPRPKRLMILHTQVLALDSPYFSALKEFLIRFDSSWEIVLRCHFNEVDHGLACAKALGVRVESHEIPLEEALAKTRVVVGVYSTALFESWIAGCRVVHLSEMPFLLRRYADSPNVGWSEEPVALDSDEDRRVQRLSAISRSRQSVEAMPQSK